MNYSYIKEVDLDGTVVPVGHYNISTWSSNGAKASHIFEIDFGDETEDPLTLPSGILRIMLVDSSTQQHLNTVIDVPVAGGYPLSQYSATGDTALVGSILYAGNPVKTTFTINTLTPTFCSVMLQESRSCNIQACNGSKVSRWATLEQKIDPIILRKDVDYGDSLPTNAVEGQLFFVKI